MANYVSVESCFAIGRVESRMEKLNISSKFSLLSSRVTDIPWDGHGLH